MQKASRNADLLDRSHIASFSFIFSSSNCFLLVGEPQKKLSKAIARELLETEENYLNLLRFTVKDLKECLIDDTQSEYFWISYASRIYFRQWTNYKPNSGGSYFWKSS